MDFENTIPLDCYANGGIHLPEELGSLDLVRQDGEQGITYYDWNLRFRQETNASRPDNSGKDEIQLIFNLNRPIEWHIDDGRETVRMQPGEVCVFRNNDYKTSMIYGAGCEFAFKSLQMDTGYFQDLLARYFPVERIADMERLFLTHVTKTAITPDMHRILSEIDSADKYREFKGVFMEGKMMALIALVLYGISYRRTESVPRLPAACRTDVQKLEELRRRIQLDPAQEYRAASLAASLGMSESKLSRLFKALYGMPLHAYVRGQRLERAASLIHLGSANISEAAAQSGYANLSHFSKEFQKHFGVTPKKFARDAR